MYYIEAIGKILEALLVAAILGAVGFFASVGIGSLEMQLLGIPPALWGAAVGGFFFVCSLKDALPEIYAEYFAD